MSEKLPIHKIIIAGLDAVGKTSIYQKMIEGVDPSVLKTLPPTRGIKRMSQVIMDHQLVFWDLGGQAVYRSQYFNDPKTFIDSEIVIYVLDIQDTERFDESLEYLLQILMVIKNLEDPPRVFILMHKFDPDSFNELKNNFLEASILFKQVRSIPNMDVTRFPTSIYSDNLNFAFKKILQKIIPDYSDPFADLFIDDLEDIDKLAEETTPDQDSSGVAEVGIEIDHITNKESLKSQIVQQFQAAISKIEKKNREHS